MRGVAVAGGSRLRAGASVLTIVRGLAASRRIDVAGDVLHHASFDNVHSLEARSRGPRPRCLRFAAFLPALAVVGPRKTRFRVVANLCRAGLEPAGSQMKFQLCLHGILLIQAFPTQAGGVTAASVLAMRLGAATSGKRGVKPQRLARLVRHLGRARPRCRQEPAARKLTTPSSKRADTSSERRLPSSHSDAPVSERRVSPTRAARAIGRAPVVLARREPARAAA